MLGPKDSKAVIRQRLLAQRLELTPSQVRSWSQHLFSNLMGSALLNGVKAVGLYAATRGEVDTSRVHEALRKTATITAYPRVEEDGLQFYEAKSLEEMTAGTWGILEPKPERGVPLETIGVLIVPGVAFDERGYRIGFGKGHYDRLLERFSGTAVGFAYEFQMVKDVPHGPLDRPCHWVVTEKRLIEGRGG